MGSYATKGIICFLILLWRAFKAFVIVALIILFIHLLKNINSFLAYIDNLNPTFYINKYSLIPILGIAITLGIFIYNRKRDFYKKAAEKEFDLSDEYYKTLKNFNVILNNILWMQHHNFYLLGQPEEFLSKICIQCEKMFTLQESFGDFTHWIFLDKHVEMWFFYRDLMCNFELALSDFQRGKLTVSYGDEAETPKEIKNKSFRLPDLADNILPTSIFPY